MFVPGTCFQVLTQLRDCTHSTSRIKEIKGSGGRLQSIYPKSFYATGCTSGPSKEESRIRVTKTCDPTRQRGHILSTVVVVI